VEAQHVAATMALVDSLEEQQALERILDDTKPPVPPAARKLHWLLFTPFRYPPPPRGSRFRGPNDPGVFYGADEIRTACAELGYWRWRHLQDTPALAAMPTKPQTVFRAALAGAAIDLRRAPFATARARWTDPADYAPCQALARTARDAAVATVRYESVRDPQRGGCAAVLAQQLVEVGKVIMPKTVLANACRGCHGATLSGGRIPGAPAEMAIPLNITPHETGLAGWTYTDFDKLLSTGIRRNGKTLDPMMPVTELGKFNQTERQALWAFLQTVPAKPFGER